MNNSLPIGIFDSGLGGLTVLKELQHLLPNESFIYVGDTAHVPYGNKSKDAVIRYSNKITSFLASHNVKLIVIACNTASSVAKNQLQEKFKFPIIDVITPLYDHLCSYEKNTINKVGIIGTYNTINSQSYNEIIYKYDKNVKIISKACPLFVPIIEEGFHNHNVARGVCQEYLSDFNSEKIDLLVLGCTHYPIMADTIKQVLVNDISIVDSALTTAEYVKKFIIKNQLDNQTTAHNSTQILVTDKAPQFKEFAQKFLLSNQLNIKEINL